MEEEEKEVIVCLRLRAPARVKVRVRSRVRVRGGVIVIATTRVRRILRGTVRVSKKKRMGRDELKGNRTESESKR